MSILIEKQHRIKWSPGDSIFEVVIYLLCMTIFFSVLYPLYFVVIASFSDPVRVLIGDIWLIPKGITFVGYSKIFADTRIWIGYANTIIYTVFGTFVSIIVTLPAAYALSRSDFRARRGIMIFFIITMFFNGGLVPSYLLIQKIKLVDTLWVMVIPFCVNVFYLIIARTFFENNISKELRDAASIDGCSNTRFFLKIALPLSKAIIAVIALYYAVGQWNEFFRALIYLRNDKRFPLQIILMNILVRNDTRNTTGLMGELERMQLASIIKYGLIIVSMVPILLVYPFIQKYFTKGIMIGSIKG